MRHNPAVDPLRETVEHIVREIQPKPKSWEDYEAAKARIYRIGNQKKERIITSNGETLACEIVPPDHADGVGYRPHWSTCPSAGKFKRPL